MFVESLYKKIKNFKIYKPEIFYLCIVGCIFFIIYSSLGFISPYQYNSPDEQANYFFIDLFTKTNSLQYKEPLNKIVAIVHPRSMGVIGENIVPGSFIGLILFLAVFAKFKYNLFLFIIPFISAFIPIIFFFIIDKIFNNKRLAFLSSLILFIHPAFWYYSTRFLFPNILQLNLLLIAVFLILYSKKFLKYSSFILLISGGIAGFAISIRLNEFFWISLILIFSLIYLFYINKDIKEFLKFLFCFILGFLIGIFPVLFFNFKLYGSPFFTGYFQVNSLLKNGSVESKLGFLQTIFKLAFIPFGFNLDNIINNVINYHLRFWLFTVLWLIGICIIFYKNSKDFYFKNSKKIFLYFILFLVIFMFLSIYYGSWKFNDHPNPKAVSIGTSYIRYWLIIYVMSIPFIAITILFISNFFKSKDLKRSLIFVFWFCLFFSSHFLVVWGTDESLLQVLDNIKRGRQEANFVMQNTKKNSIIIVDYDDKFLFPKRKVISNFRSKVVQKFLKDFVKYTDVYYFGLTLPEKDIKFLNTDRFYKQSLFIYPINSFSKKTLYKIILKKYDSRN